MGRVVIVTSATAGRINLSCELVRRLHDAGHEAMITSPFDIAEQVAAQGLTWVPLGAPASDERTAPPAEKASAVARLIAFAGRLKDVRTVRARREVKVEALGLDAFRDTLRELAPDLLLIDIELPAHIMAARSTGVPLVLTTTMLSLWKRPGLPPLHRAILPGVGWRGRPVGIEWAWVRFRAWKWLRNQRLRVTRLGEDQLSVLDVVAKRTGFSLRSEALKYHWLIPFVYRTIPVLEFNAQEFEFPHDPFPTVRYVGPLLNTDGSRHGSDPDVAAARERLASIYEQRQSGRSDALVYVSFGAWHRGDDGDSFRRIFAAIERRPNWDLVVGLGGRVEPKALGDLPPNVHPFVWAPQMEVLEVADVAVHHAGINSINECVIAGVPMLVYPFDYGDTAGAAARVEFHGLGIVGERGDSPVVIERRIARLLGDPDFGHRVREMRDHFLVYEREQRALREIESWLP